MGLHIPFVSREEMKKIDDTAVNRFGVEIPLIMENAGRAVAIVAKKMLKKIKSKNVLILAGKGNNGGDGLVAARFLSNWGAKVTIISIEHPDKMNKLSKWHLETARSMHVNRLFSTDSLRFEFAFKQADLVIDALFGYNINGNPRGIYADVIRMANNSRKILAVDIPSGLDADSGEPYEPCIEADATVTFALPKKGLKNRKYAGKIYVADIGMPHEVYERLGMDVGRTFEKNDIIKM